MAPFSRDPSEWQRLDWRLLQNGGVALYFRETTLSGDIVWLREHDYVIHEFDCTQWQSEEALHADFKATLQFPDYYGKNFDALNDCLSDLEISQSGGTALVFQSFDAYVCASEERVAVGSPAWTILDILAHRSRDFLLTGQRLLVLVQSDNPRISFDRIGGLTPCWNPKEWLNKNRGL